MLNYTRLGELIKASNMNKTALATKCKVSRVTIDNLLQGGDVRLSTLNTIAKELGVSTASLMDDYDRPVQIGVVSQSGNVTKVNEANYYAGDAHALMDKVKLLERIIEEKERTIQILSKR